MEIKQTPLFEEHKKLGAKIVTFAGYYMPVQYSSIIEEHNAVRSKVGIFDVSHMGEIEFRGEDALENIQRLISNDASRLKIGQALYSGMLYENGTFVDDIICYHLDNNYYMFCVNAANTEKDYEWIKNNVKGKVTVENKSYEIAQIAVQGPLSREVLKELVDFDIEKLPYYWSTYGKVNGYPALVSRTGYTGELGYEIYVENKYAAMIWEKILEIGKKYDIKPAGLGARDTLRLEASMPLYGNDIDDTVTPLEAGLKWIVKFRKKNFIGYETLLKQYREGIKKKLVGFEVLDKRIARHNYKIYYNGKPVGRITSGTFAPFLKKNIAMGYVPIELAKIDNILDIDIRGKMVKAKIVPLPFYKGRQKDY